MKQMPAGTSSVRAALLKSTLWFAVTGVAALGIVTAAMSPVMSAERGGPGESASPRKNLRQARAALSASHLQEALHLYERVLAQELLPGPRRAEALYGAGMLRLHPDPALQEIEKARVMFQEIRSAYPEHERRLEAEVALALIGRIELAAAESEGLRAEMAEREGTSKVERDRLSRELAGAEAEAESLRSQLPPLRTELQSLRGEVQTLRSDLQKKDEALKKVKDALVGSKKAR